MTTPTQWLPAATRKPKSFGSSYGYQGTGAKVVWHTTESDTGSISWLPGFFENRHEGPHLIWDPWTGEFVQMLPVKTPATALADPNRVGTNHWGEVVIQIEVIGRAGLQVLTGQRVTKQGRHLGSPMKGAGELVAWLRSWGVPDNWPAGVPMHAASGNRTVYAKRSPAGHYGHCQIPDNTHVDPGHVNASLLFEEDTVQQSDIDAIVKGVFQHKVRTGPDSDPITFGQAVNRWQMFRDPAHIAAAAAEATVKALQDAGLVNGSVDVGAISSKVISDLAAKLAEPAVPDTTTP